MNMLENLFAGSALGSFIDDPTHENILLGSLLGIDTILLSNHP